MYVIFGHMVLNEFCVAHKKYQPLEGHLSGSEIGINLFTSFIVIH